MPPPLTVEAKLQGRGRFSVAQCELSALAASPLVPGADFIFSRRERAQLEYSVIAGDLEPRVIQDVYEHEHVGVEIARDPAADLGLAELTGSSDSGAGSERKSIGARRVHIVNDGITVLEQDRLPCPDGHDVGAKHAVFLVDLHGRSLERKRPGFCAFLHVDQDIGKATAPDHPCLVRDLVPVSGTSRVR